MISNNFFWMIGIAGAVFLAGFWIYWTHLGKKTIVDLKQAKRNRWYRYLGLFLMVASLASIFYFGYIDRPRLRKKANMNGACDVCKQYMQRKKQLKSFDPKELNVLDKYTQGCNKCLEECNFDREQKTDLARRLGKESLAKDLHNFYSRKCAGIRANAEAAGNDLAGLRAKLVQAGRTDVLPSVPN